jgi:hypothetical protein
MRAGRPAHPGCMWFSVPGSWFSVRDARAPRRHVVLGSWFLVLGSGCPHSWYAPGSRTCGRDARTPGTRRGRAHAGGDARAPRMHVVLGSWFLVLGSGRPRTQDACGSRFLVPGSRFGTPAHPACAGLRVCGRDARAPRGHVVLGSWFLVLGSGRPRTQGARGSRFSVLGSRFLVLGSWFLVPGSWFSIRDARTPRDTLRRSPAGASTCSARASARSLRLHPHPFATCSRRNCANTIRPVWV